MKRTRPRLAAGLLAAGLLAVTGCSGSGSTAAKTTTTSTTVGPGAGRTVTIGSTGSTETNVVMELYGGKLEHLGFTVTRRADLAGREGEYNAIEKGEVAVVPASTLSLLSHLTHATASDPTTPTVAAQLVTIRSGLPDKLTVLRPSFAESKPVIACNSTVASRLNLQKIDDLIQNAPELVMGGPKEFVDLKPFGIAGFKDLGAVFKSFTALDGAGPATVAALKAGKVDCALLVSTDPAIKTNSFVALLDARDLSPADAVLPYLTKDLAADPRVVAAFDGLDARLDTVGLASLVRSVVVDKSKPADVAKQWLQASGLTRG
jgi:osmoprotectant transport system substrate-binding protein